MFNHGTHCAGDTAIFDSAAAFLREQGRMKYLRPLYKALAGSGAQGRALAQVKLFHLARNILYSSWAYCDLSLYKAGAKGRRWPRSIRKTPPQVVQLKTSGSPLTLGDSLLDADHSDGGSCCAVLVLPIA